MNMAEKYIRLSVFLFLSFKVLAQTEEKNIETAKVALQIKGYKEITGEYHGRYGYELSSLLEKGKRDNFYRYVTVREGVIVYTFLFLNQEEPNMSVFAYVLDENMEPPYIEFEAMVDRNGVVQKETIKKLTDYYLDDGTGRQRFFHWVHYDMDGDGCIQEGEGNFFNNEYMKINQHNEEANLWIKMDMNGDGIIEEDEGRIAWY
jgi:hypothetical protein